MTVQVAIAQINSTVGDLAGNCARIVEFSRRAAAQGADIVLTPELSLTGYPPEDLLLRQSFYAKTARMFEALTLQLAEFKDLHVVIGHAIAREGARFNAASVVVNGTVLGTYCKCDLPNDTVFDEKRYFSSSQQAFVFVVKDVHFGLNICEDTWFPHAPARAKAAGAQVLLVPNASPFHMNKQYLRYDTMRANVVAHGLSVVYANLIGGQDELIFDGSSFAMDGQGQVRAQLRHCAEDLQLVAFDGAEPRDGPIAAELPVEAQVYQALVLGVRDYVGKNGFPSVLIGLSGGVDSALTLAIAVDALGADRVRCVMMPSPYTAEISWIDSREMAQRVGVRYDEIPITECFNAFRATLAHEFEGMAEDATEENYPGPHSRHHPDGAFQQARLDRPDHRQQERNGGRLLYVIRRHGRRLCRDQGHRQDAGLSTLRVPQYGCRRDSAAHSDARAVGRITAGSNRPGFLAAV